MPLELSPPIRSRIRSLILPILVLSTLAAFSEVRQHDYINFDDDTYVQHNPKIREGLTWEGIRWAFSVGIASDFAPDMWIPLTYLSHMAVIELFGNRPAAHHSMNLLLHVLNSVLLFGVLRRITGKDWPSALVAALFAVHPFQVESVAWITERKGLLSATFFLLALSAYVRYAEKPSFVRYLPIVVAYAGSLMAKPTLITLPFVFLLLDYWPLGRIPSSGLTTRGGLAILGRRIVEKIPLLVLTVASAFMTHQVMLRWGLVASSEQYGLGTRVANAAASYATYIQKAVWPSGFAVFYPHPGADLPMGQVIGAGLLLSALSIAAMMGARKRPYQIIGWLWFLGTLIPVIGLVQVSSQAMADRYAYVPLVGLFVMFAWTVSDFSISWRHRGPILFFSAFVVLSALVGFARVQVGHWRNSITVFEQALRVTEGNYMAHNNLGIAHRNLDRLDAAVDHFRMALRIKPAFGKGHFNLAESYQSLGRLEEAAAEYRVALNLPPSHALDHASTRNNLAAVYQSMGRFEDAIRESEAALRIAPKDSVIYNNLGVSYRKLGRFDEAIEALNRSIALRNDFANPYSNLANVLSDQGKKEEAVQQYQKAIALDPGFVDAHFNLAGVYQDMGRIDDSIAAFETVIRLDPEDLAARTRLADLYVRMGRYPEAIAQYQWVLDRTPDDARAHLDLGRILLEMENAEEARIHIERALQLEPGLEPARRALENLSEYLPRILRSEWNYAMVFG
jgi:protein O-mannosyl-transferase